MKTILVIEDEPEMRRNITTLLRFKGYKPVAAENGRVGVDAARRERPDLILCDVMMPELDGYGVLRALQTDPDLSFIPFIFLTAKGEKEDLRSGMNLGADDYLTKPVGRDDLLAAVRTRLTRQKAHQTEIHSAKGNGSGFNPDFSSPLPLQTLGLTEREAEVLLWVTQGKGNADVGVLLNMAEKTVKKHMSNIFEKLGVESRNAATLRALEVLSGGK